MSYELLGILIAVVTQGLYVAFKMGKFEEKLNALEKKQDKHNNVIERVAINEQKVKSAHKRLDDGEKHFETMNANIEYIKNFLLERVKK